MLVTVGVITEIQGIIIGSRCFGSHTHVLLSYLQLNLLVRKRYHTTDFSLMILRVNYLNLKYWSVSVGSQYTKSMSSLGIHHLECGCVYPGEEICR